MRNTTQIKVRLPFQLHKALQHIAKARGVTVTALVKKAIREELAGCGPILRDGKDTEQGNRNTEQGKGS